MKWILVLPCVFWSNTVILATSDAQSLGQVNEHEQAIHYRQSSQCFYEEGKLEGDLLHFATSRLKQAIESRAAKLLERSLVPLSEVKQKELSELTQRRLVLLQEGQDLYNEKRLRMEKLEAKRQMASRFKDDLLLLEKIDQTDNKIEVLEKDDEENRRVLIQERRNLEKGLSAKGACVFRLRTSLGVLQNYLAAEDWSDMTRVLNNVIDHIQRKSRKAMSHVYLTIPGESISSNKTVVLEGLLQKMPQFLSAINRFIPAFDREMVVAMSLSNRPDLLESYEAEMASADHPTEKLLYALGILERYRSNDQGFEGSTQELEEQLQSLEAAILIVKEQEAERIRQIMNQNPPINLVSSEEEDEDDSEGSEEVNASEEESHKNIQGSSDNEGEAGAAGEPQNVLSQGNAGIPQHAEAVLALNAEENLDTDTYFGQFQTGAHLAAFIKIKNMETQKGVLCAFLESAHQEETRKHQDPNLWRLNLWISALEKGLLNITQIQPVIKTLQELVILGE